MSAPNDLILYHYPPSPYARRVTWYLALRGIPYAQCLQPFVMPRPDLASLGVHYRRIPVLAHGRHIYCDSRLIIQHLETAFPDGKLGASAADARGVERLLERWTVDAGVFVRAAQLIPGDSPTMKDQAFLKDRTAFSGRAWSEEAQKKGRPEALVYMRDAFELLETTLLADGRDWILKTATPSLADIEAIWPLHWVAGMPNALPTNLISPQQFPKVFAWITRFNAAVSAASSSAAKPIRLDGKAAAAAVASSFMADQAEGVVDHNDPLGLKLGDEVEVWPIDSGFGYRDKGKLVMLTSTELEIAFKTEQGDEVRLHTPRWGFRVQKVGAQDAKL